MTNIHDPIYESSGQKGSIDSISVTFWNSLFDLPGASEPAESAMDVGLLRLAQCDVRPEHRDHFIDVQQGIWNPGMAETGAILGGIFCESRDDRNRFLVCSYWTTASDHSDYRKRVFPGLYSRAKAERDCDAVTGWAAATESGWRVTPS